MSQTSFLSFTLAITTTISVSTIVTEEMFILICIFSGRLLFCLSFCFRFGAGFCFGTCFSLCLGALFLTLQAFGFCQFAFTALLLLALACQSERLLVLLGHQVVAGGG